jgi:hypothetical protein
MVKDVLADQCDEETWVVVVVVVTVMHLIMAVVVADEVEVEADVVVVVAVVIKVHRGLHGTKITHETLCVQIFY